MWLAVQNEYGHTIGAVNAETGEIEGVAPGGWMGGAVVQGTDVPVCVACNRPDFYWNGPDHRACADHDEGASNE